MVEYKIMPILYKYITDQIECILMFKILAFEYLFYSNILI